MKIKNKIIIGLSAFILLVPGAICGTFLYLYYNPSMIKPFLERTISRATDMSFSMENISFSRKPLAVMAEGITLTPDNGSEGFFFNLPSLNADISLEGDFGNRTLVIKKLTLDGLSLQISSEFSLPEIIEKRSKSDDSKNILKKMVGLLIFRKMGFNHLIITDGEVKALWQGGEAQVDSLQAHMVDGQGVRFSCRSSIDWPAGGMSLFVPEISLKTLQPISFDPRLSINGRLVINDALVSSSMAEIRELSQEAVINYDHGSKTLEIESLQIKCPRILLKGNDERRDFLPDVLLDINGGFDIADLSLQVKDYMLRVGSLLTSKGQVDMKMDPFINLTLVSSESRLIPEKLIPYLPLRIRERFNPLHFSGPVDIRGSIKIAGKGEAMDFWNNLSVKFENNPYEIVLEKARLSGNVHGEVRTKGNIRDLDITTDIEIENSLFSGKGIQIDPFKVSLSAGGKYPQFSLNRLAADFTGITMEIDGKTLIFEEIKVAADEGEFDVGNIEGSFSNLHIESSLLKNISLSLEYGKGESIFSITGEDMGIPVYALNSGFIPQGWTFRGTESLELHGELRDNGYCSFTSLLGISGLQFEGAGGNILGDGISLNMSLEGETDFNNARIGVDSRVDSPKGQLLYDRFYFDFEDNPFAMEFNGAYNFSGKEVRLNRAMVESGGVITLYSEGNFIMQEDGHLLDLSLDIPETSLKPIYVNFLLEPFKMEKPFLTGLDMNGNLRATVDVRADTRGSEIKGTINLEDNDILINDKGISVFDMDLELPFWYRTNAHAGYQEPVKGQLSIQNLVVPWIPEQGIVLPLEAVPNQISVISPARLKIPGGEAVLGPIEVRDIFSTTPMAETSLHIQDINIVPFLSNLGINDIEGVLRGELDPIIMKGSEISSSGNIQANVFKGDVTVSNIGAEGIFTPSTLFKSDIKWKDLDLGAITTGTSFGKIQGILNGHLKNLEIAYGQPQRFELLMETEETEGIDQKISVKAVDNIARLGGGRSPFAGMAGAFATLFKEFPYKKIGVHASLENDVFRVNGTIKEDDVEYIIKRKGFSGVNVVNQNPDNRISFKEMVKRIKRVTSSRQGPVIN